MDKIPLQTLQVYRKIEKIPANAKLKRLESELCEIRRNFPMPVAYRHPERFVSDDGTKILNSDEYHDPPRVTSIELQNKVAKIENQLASWVNDYRNMIDNVRELEHLLPKTHYDLSESESEAREDVEKIAKIEEIKERVVEEFNNLCIRCEECEAKSKRKIRRLEMDLAGSQAKVENLEYDLRRLRKHMEIS
jgi:CO dehydrogenase/acetyl-CoA synthase alpha subunit